jgi:hypothetical protein
VGMIKEKYYEKRRDLGGKAGVRLTVVSATPFGSELK